MSFDPGELSTLVARASMVPVDPTIPAAGGSRYEHRADLGKGGMGEVKLDRDRHIGREVAVKRLHPHLRADANAKARFLREARVQGQLEHPSIVPVYDLGADGEPFFTMKRVHGRTLAEILTLLEAGDADALRRYTFRRLLSAFSQVCLAVDYAHARGVVHRDLKPQNVMLGEFGEVYVLDWGVAKLLGSAEHPAPIELPASMHVETMAGYVMGTPGYMSPEQAAGHDEIVDARADVFALGAILYELLCGKKMVEVGDPAVMVMASKGGLFIPPSRRANGVAPELEAIWRDAIAPLEKRIASARELSERIERYLDGDRDREMRAQKAIEHAETARSAAAYAFETGDLEARKAAAREAGRALALDPDQASARATLGELLTRLPPAMPEEARASYEAEERERMRGYFKNSAIGLAIWAPLLLGFALFVGLKTPWPLIAGSAILGVACVLTWRGMRAKDPASAWHVLGTLGVMTLSLVPMCMSVSPVLIVPPIATLITVLVAVFPGRATHWSIALVSTAPLLAYGLLDASGVLPHTFRVEDGTLVVDPWAGTVYQPWMLYSTMIYSVLPPGLTALALRKFTDEAAASRKSFHTSRWQLAQILPAG